MVTEHFLSMFPKPGTVYLQTSRLLPVQRTLSNVAWRPGFSKGPMTDIQTTVITIILSMFFIILSLSSSLSLSLSSFYHHYLMLCVIGLYIYCRKRNTNECLQLQFRHLSGPDTIIHLLILNSSCSVNRCNHELSRKLRASSRDSALCQLSALNMAWWTIDFFLISLKILFWEFRKNCSYFWAACLADGTLECFEVISYINAIYIANALTASIQLGLLYPLNWNIPDYLLTVVI